LSWASSTCALPSPDRACRAKDVQDQRRPSRTLTRSRSSRFRSCPGDSSSSRITASRVGGVDQIMDLLRASLDHERGLGRAWRGTGSPGPPHRRPDPPAPPGRRARPVLPLPHPGPGRPGGALHPEQDAQVRRVGFGPEAISHALDGVVKGRNSKRHRNRTFPGSALSGNRMTPVSLCDRFRSRSRCPQTWAEENSPSCRNRRRTRSMPPPAGRRRWSARSERSLRRAARIRSPAPRTTAASPAGRGETTRTSAPADRTQT